MINERMSCSVRPADRRGGEGAQGAPELRQGRVVAPDEARDHQLIGKTTAFSDTRKFYFKALFAVGLYSGPVALLP